MLSVFPGSTTLICISLWSWTKCSLILLYFNIFSLSFSLLDPQPIHINGKFLTPKVTISTVMVRGETATSHLDPTLFFYPMVADSVLITLFLLQQAMWLLLPMIK